MTPPFHTHETLPVVYMLLHGITVNQLSQKITFHLHISRPCMTLLQ